MSLDPSRDALQRVAREINVDLAQHPDHLATEIIRHIQRQKASADALEALVQARNLHLEDSHK